MASNRGARAALSAVLELQRLEPPRLELPGLEPDVAMNDLLRPRVQAKLDKMSAREAELIALIASGTMRSDRMAPLQRELGSLSKVVRAYEALVALIRDIDEQRPFGKARRHPEFIRSQSRIGGFGRRVTLEPIRTQR